MSHREAGGRRDDRGAAAVEFALVLPLLLLIVMGISQFGITFSQWLQIEHAAREGARWGSLGYAAGAVGQAGTVRFKVDEAAPSLYPRLTNAQITVTPANPIDHSGDPVTVQVTYPTPVLPLIGSALGWTGPTLTLRATAIDRIE